MGRSETGQHDHNLMAASLSQVHQKDQTKSRSVKNMNREQAIKYLEEKGKNTSEAQIKQVMSEGKIYGDPLVEMDV